MTIAPEVALPEVVVDRSPELARGAAATVPHSAGSKSLALTAGGVRGDGAACALARMFTDNYPNVAEVHIEGEHPYLVTASGVRCPITMTAEIATWIGRFDRGENPGPMMVQIELTPIV